MEGTDSATCSTVEDIPLDNDVVFPFLFDGDGVGGGGGEDAADSFCFDQRMELDPPGSSNEANSRSSFLNAAKDFPSK